MRRERLGQIEEYISDVGYYRTSIGDVAYNNPNCRSGYCIEELNSVRGTYYKITTYVVFDFPIVGRLANFPVTGETRVIYSL